MIAVVLDSNAIHRDPWLKNPAGTRLLELAAKGSCEILLSEVVVAELTRQQREKLQAHRDGVSEMISAMSQADPPQDERAMDLKHVFAPIAAQIEKSFEELVAQDGVIKESLPAGAVSRLIERDLARRRPFAEIVRDKKPVSVGFRDAVIWESVLEILSPGRGYRAVVFVTKDKGFLADDGSDLHPHLVEDLRDRGIDCRRLIAAKEPWLACTQVESLVTDTAYMETQTLLLTLATDALLALQSETVSMQTVYGGDYDYPDFVRFNVPPLEDATIEDIEQISEFTLSHDGDVVRASAEVWLSLSGYITKSDWFVDEGENVSLLEDWNDHYFRGGSELTLRATIEIDVSGDEPAVVSAVLSEQGTN